MAKGRGKGRKTHLNRRRRLKLSVRKRVRKFNDGWIIIEGKAPLNDQNYPVGDYGQVKPHRLGPVKPERRDLEIRGAAPRPPKRKK